MNDRVSPKNRTLREFGAPGSVGYPRLGVGQSSMIRSMILFRFDSPPSSFESSGKSGT
ncbi:hypothetical protein ACLI4Z_02510 [Natrialbaceae archaeon A-arb3/5]